MDTRTEIEDWYIQCGGDDSLSAELERQDAFRLMLAEVWDAGFDEASDDIGRAQLLADCGESTNPYRKSD